MQSEDNSRNPAILSTAWGTAAKSTTTESARLAELSMHAMAQLERAVGFLKLSHCFNVADGGCWIPLIRGYLKNTIHGLREAETRRLYSSI